ncbi:MAG: glycosyltransferase family 4 protein [Acidobacteria bacterium]|nr:glycosyltransferase family 4 protein [Acidobacteriota bacterium]
MSRRIIISVDQLYRPQPGGIGSYVRGLVEGLVSVDGDLDVVGVGPRSRPEAVRQLGIDVRTTVLSLRLLTQLWPRYPFGVPRDADVVHATSVAGPFGGGTRRAVHTVTMHDLLWRDEPESSTPNGIRFHESRLQYLLRAEHLRIITTSPRLGVRLFQIGIDPDRIRFARLGVDDATVAAAEPARVRELLAAHGVSGPFTFYAGTREPRKNVERLVRAHHLARRSCADLGPLVLAGPIGWGQVDTGDAVVLGLVERSLLLGLYRDTAVNAYVPRAEGWGLPPVEALHAGSRVVASSNCPSVDGNAEVVLVDPLSDESIAQGLLRALEQGDDTASRERRRGSVAHMTWHNCALDHLTAWQ